LINEKKRKNLEFLEIDFFLSFFFGLLGIGANKNTTDNWLENTFAYDNLLKSLNESFQGLFDFFFFFLSLIL